MNGGYLAGTHGGYLAGTQGDVTNARAYDVSNRHLAAGFYVLAEDVVRFVLRVANGTVVLPGSVKQLWTRSQNRTQLAEPQTPELRQH